MIGLSFLFFNTPCQGKLNPNLREGNFIFSFFIDMDGFFMEKAGFLGKENLGSFKSESSGAKTFLILKVFLGRRVSFSLR